MMAIKPHYITDSEGRKISAVLPIKQFESLLENLEELEDIRLYDESKNDKERSLSKEEAMIILEAERKNLSK